MPSDQQRERAELRKLTSAHKTYASVARAQIPLASAGTQKPTSSKTGPQIRMPWSKPQIAAASKPTEEPPREESPSSIATSFAHISVSEQDSPAGTPKLDLNAPNPPIPNWAAEHNDDAEWGVTPTEDSAQNTTPTDNTHDDHVSPDEQADDDDELSERSDAEDSNNEAYDDDELVEKRSPGAKILYDGSWIFDAHIHMMEYTGNYFNNAQTYQEWVQDLPEGVEFAGALNVLHDPALWGDENTDQANSPVSYVHENYAHIMPTGKIVGLGVGCHPKFCDYERYDKDTYSVERVEAALERIFNTEENPTFHGKVPMVVGECGLEFGISRNERGKTFEKPTDAQINMLKAHIRIAQKFKKPIMLHIRGDTYETQQELERCAIQIFKEMHWDKHQSIIRHSYAGGPDTAQDWTENWERTYFSFSLASRTHLDSRRFMDGFDPELDNVIVETDAPLLSRDVPGNSGLKPNDSRRRPAHSNDLVKVIDKLHDQRLDIFPQYKEVLTKLGDNVFNAYELDQEFVIAALEADVTPTENPRDWQQVFPEWHTGIPRRRGRQDPQQRPQQEQRQAAEEPPARPAGRSRSPRRPAENVNRWRRAESPRRPNKALFPRRNIPENTPNTLRPLEQLPQAIPNAQRDKITVREARQTLLVQTSNSSAGGLEMFRECAKMHDRPPKCNGTTVVEQFPSLKEAELSRAGLSPEELEYAHRVRNMKIPSFLHLVLLEWAVRVPRELNNRYLLCAQIIGADVQKILYLFEDYILAHSGTQLHPLAREYVYAAVHKWSFCCKPLQDTFKKFKTVGPVQYVVRAPTNATPFIKDVIRFIAFNMSTGIDRNRAQRLSKGSRHPERTVVNSTVLFIGDTNAAALASRCTMTGGQYAQMHHWNELHTFLDNVYFGHNVQTVVISIGRADLPQYDVHNGASAFEQLVKNYIRQLQINFPHVEFFFFFPPYDHGQKELVEQALLDFPDSFGYHPNQFRQRAPTEEEDEVDAYGNLTSRGLLAVIDRLRNDRASFAQIYNPQAEIAPLQGGPLRDAAFFEFVPRRQMDPPIGPGDLVYDDTEEPAYLTSYPDNPSAEPEPPREVEDTPSKSPPRQKPRMDAHSNLNIRVKVANVGPLAKPQRSAKRDIALDYSAAVATPPAAAEVPAPPLQTLTPTAASDVVIDLSGRQDAAQIIAQVAQMAFEQDNAANAPGPAFQRIVITSGTSRFTLDASPTVLTYLLGHGLLQLAAAPRQ